MTGGDSVMAWVPVTMKELESRLARGWLIDTITRSAAKDLLGVPDLFTSTPTDFPEGPSRTYDFAVAAGLAAGWVVGNWWRAKCGEPRFPPKADRRCRRRAERAFRRKLRDMGLLDAWGAWPEEGLPLGVWLRALSRTAALEAFRAVARLSGVDGKPSVN